MIFLLLYWLLKKEVEKKLTSKWGIIFKLFGMNETKGYFVDMWIVINRNKIAYKNSIGAQDGQKQDCVKITSAEEELITISCEVVQGNVNFLFLIHVWSNFILHMYFWLSIQRISLTFYGYLLHVWHILFIYFCFWLGTLTWTSFPINCLWNCSNLNHNTNVNFHYSIHVWTTLMLLLYLWLSFQRISLTFYGCVLHIQYILHVFG